MARKKKQHVDYFPHDTHQSKSVRIISKKYGNDGYAFYYKLRELLGRTENYNYDLSKEIDWFDFLGEMDIEEQQAKELIEFLVTIGELDKEMWEKEKRLWSDRFMAGIVSVYDKRVTEIPHKYSFRDGNTHSRSGNPSLGDGSTQSRVKESKVNKSRVVENGKAHTTLDLNPFLIKYPRNDVEYSYERFKLNQQKKGVKSDDVTAEEAAFEMWLMSDLKYEKNLRAPEVNNKVTRHCPNRHGFVEVLAKDEYKGVFCEKCDYQMVHVSELVKSELLPF